MNVVLRGAPRPARADVGGGDDSLGILTVRYSALNSWYRIDSWWEGTFMERILPGSATYDSVEGIRTLFNHGYDPQVGGKSLGVPRAAGERDGYAFTEVPLLDTSYVRDLLPGLRAGAYGSSFMFEVKEESWDWDPEPSESNPSSLPERSIRGYQLFEDGPVTWPANPASDVQMNSAQQSGTDWYYTQLERSGLLKNGEEIRSRLRSIDRSEGRHPLTAGKRLKVLRELELRG